MLLICALALRAESPLTEVIATVMPHIGLEIAVTRGGLNTKKEVDGTRGC